MKRLREKSSSDIAKEIIEEHQRKLVREFLKNEYNYSILLRKSLQDFVRKEGDALTLGEYKQLASEIGRLTLKIEEIKNIYYERFEEKI